MPNKESNNKKLSYNFLTEDGCTYCTHESIEVLIIDIHKYNNIKMSCNTMLMSIFVLIKSLGDAVVPRKGKTHGLKIFQRYHFASALKRMSVIAGHTPPGSVDTDYIASVKGAPETLRSMVGSYRPQTKLREGNLSTRVCHSVRKGVWCHILSGPMFLPEGSGPRGMV